MQNWCAQQNVPLGEVLTVGQVWALSRLWYEDRMQPSFSGRTIDEAHRIFASLGLTSVFWRFT
ncbi:MAG: hypothetical protein KDE28_27995 [Anaerolineales bacterium]|nr:hypothetical protein [Anaerolineales bacterium]MCB0031798.1 hypothetical protein [Anaerolineales bacterium]